MNPITCESYCLRIYCDKFSGFWRISRGLRPREILQPRKSYAHKAQRQAGDD